jgi:hypothetical protein
VHELYVVGCQPGVSTKLNPALVPGGEELDLQAQPDSGKVYYIASQDTAGVELTASRRAPQATTKLNDPLANGAGGLVPPRPMARAWATSRMRWTSSTTSRGGSRDPGTAVRMTPNAAGSGVYDFLYSSDGTKIVILGMTTISPTCIGSTANPGTRHDSMPRWSRVASVELNLTE